MSSRKEQNKKTTNNEKQKQKMTANRMPKLFKHCRIAGGLRLAAASARPWVAAQRAHPSMGRNVGGWGWGGGGECWGVACCFVEKIIRLLREALFYSVCLKSVEVE